MKIANNIAALQSTNFKSKNTVALSKSIEKLSSGKRINSASNDAAGLSISEKMKAQIRGLTQASKNALDGISLVQTADGALEEMTNIAQRIRELCVQASNDTLTDSDRQSIQLELDEHKQEMTRISNHTDFNTRKLLDGTLKTDVLKQKTEWVTVEETVTETVTEIIYETVKELQEKTIVSYINENLSVDVDLDLSSIDTHKSTALTSGDDTLFINMIRQSSNSISVTINGPSGVLVNGTHSASTSPISLALSQYGGPDFDGFTKVIQTSDGGYATVGFSQTVGDDIVSNEGSQDIWVMKFDKNFSKEWSFSVGTDGYDRGYDIIEMPGGNIAVAGYTKDHANSHGNSFAAIIKSDGSKTIWERPIGGLKDDRILNVEVASDGNLLLIGGTLSGEGDLTLGDHPSYLSCLLKVDADTGALLNSKYLSFLSGNLIFDTVPTGSETFIGVGGAGHNQMIIAFNENGTQLWNKTHEQGTLYEVDLMSDGSIVALGGHTEDNKYSKKLYCYDSEGNLKWNIKLPYEFYNGSDTLDGFSINDRDEVIVSIKTSVTHTKNFIFNKYGDKIEESVSIFWGEVNSVFVDDDGNTITAGIWDSDGFISATAPAGTFPSSYLVNENGITFGSESKSIKSGFIKFEGSASTLKATQVELQIQKPIVSTVIEEVDVIKESTIEVEVEKTITKDVLKTTTYKADESLLLQIGANAGQNMSITIDDMRPESLGFINGMPRVYPVEMAGISLTLSDQVIQKLSTQRSTLGAYQNRLEHVIKNLDNTAENLQNSESRITDMDLAKGIMEMTKLNILNQATDAMLVQANQIPQGILQLIK